MSKVLFGASLQAGNRMDLRDSAVCLAVPRTAPKGKLITQPLQVALKSTLQALLVKVSWSTAALHETRTGGGSIGGAGVDGALLWR